MIIHKCNDERSRNNSSTDNKNKEASVNSNAEIRRKWRLTKPVLDKRRDDTTSPARKNHLLKQIVKVIWGRGLNRECKSMGWGELLVLW